MTFDEILEQVVTLLKRQGRVSYSALRRRFDLDDAYLDDLKDELLFAHPVVDEAGRGLVWTGEAGASPEPTSTSTQPARQEVPQEDQPTQIEPPPPEPPTPDAERRQLTVMFYDLVGSTPLSEQLDPEDLREVVRAYQQTCAEVIQRFDGHIAQLLGDALLVYFGWPQAHEDDAQRAVRTGLGMLDAMGTLNRRLERDKGIRLAIRVGIHTGLVVVGEMGGGGHQEQLALGETPNIASRIQGMAEPDTVAISEATYRLVEGYFICQGLGEQTLKGVAAPMQVYRVLQESGAQSRLDVAATRGLTPLVGREQEVGLLVERWNQVKDGQGQVVLLSGEAGIGKSRLVQVLKAHVAGTAYTRAEHRCSPYHTHSMLYPLIDLWERMLANDHHETPHDKLSRLERILSQYRLPMDENVPLMAALLSLSLPADRYPPLTLSPQRQRQRTMEVLVALLLDLAERQPVLFVMEDLHWADPSTLEFLGMLIDQIPTAPILTLLIARPAFQQPWGNRSYLTQVTLNRLTGPHIEHIVMRITGGKPLPAEVVQQIVAKTDGVPLFVEELTKTVLESGVLRETPESYELTDPLPPLAIPATLHDSLMARLDRLVTAKGIAQLGATIGRQFGYALLRDVAQLDDGTLQRELERLVAAELLYQRGVPPQATYLFKHALIQDAAYQSLLKRTRQQVHQRIAQALADHFPETVETQPELLAHHYTQAGDMVQAMPYWQRAGQRAFEQSAHVEASRHLKRGLDLLTTLPESPERTRHELILQNALGTALSIIKGYAAPEVAHAYARAHELCGEVEDTSQLIRVLRGLQGFYTASGDFRKSLEVAERCLDLAQRQGLPAPIIGSHFAMGVTLYHRGEFIRARTHLEG
jgi:class 3 adenylate cyclase